MAHLTPRTPPRRRVCGFTLIELLIAVAIVSILAAVAFPSYQGQLRKSRRADAQAFALEVVARQQQFLLDRRTYATSVTASPASGGLGLALPAAVATHYTVSLDASTEAPPSFLLTLAPTGVQAADTCGTLTVDQAGVRRASGSGTCW